MTQPTTPAPPAHQAHPPDASLTPAPAGLRPAVCHAVAAAMALLHVALVWISRPPGILTGHDDARYLLLARSLRSFSYRSIWRADAPLEANYPPGFPALLALADAVHLRSFDQLIMLNAALSALALALVYLLVARRWNPPLGLLVLAPLAVNPYLVDLAGYVMSESAFMLWSVLAVCLLADERPGRGRLWAAGLASLVAALTRTVGIGLVAAVGLLLVSRRQWRAAVAYALGATLVIGGWMAYTLRNPEQFQGEAYTADLLNVEGSRSLAVTLAHRLAENATVYAGRALPDALALPALGGTMLDNGVWAALLALVFAAAIGGLWRRSRSVLFYLGATAAALLAYNWALVRLLVPLIPLLVLAAIVGAARLGGRRAWLAAATAALVLSAGGLLRTSAQAAARADCDRAAALPAGCISPDQASFFAAVAWIRDHIGDGPVFLTAKQATLTLYTGHRTVNFPTAIRVDPGRFLDFARDNRVSYVLLGSLRSVEVGVLAARLAASCTGLELVESFPPRTLLFRVRPPGEAEGADGPACRAVAAFTLSNRDRDFDSDF